MRVDYDDFKTLYTSEAGTPYGKGAQIQETVTALNDLGIMVIGVGTSLDDEADPRRMLEAYSRATGAVNEGDTIVVGGDDDIEPGEPLYFVVDSSLTSFASVVEAAIENQMQSYARDISGNVFSDSDEDGVHDTTEQGMSGMTVYIDFDDDGQLDAGELRVTTDASGDYVFENVVVGTAKVRVVLPADWFTTPLGQPDYQLVTVQAGYVLNHVDIGIHALTAYDDGFTTPEDVPLDIAVSSLTANDLSTVPSTTDAVYFSSVDDSASVGNVSVNGSTVTYTPAEDWSGTDTFLYSLTDGQAYVDWATVTVEVTPVNDAPRITTEFRTRDGLELSGTLAVDIETDAMTAVHYFGVEHGTFDMENDGSFTYTPEANFIGIETIWVNYVDEHGASSGDTEVMIAVCETLVGSDPRHEQVFTHDDLTDARDLYVASSRLGVSTVTDAYGDRIIVGSPDSGHAFIYRESLEGWVLEAELDGPTGYASDVAIGDGVAVVGAMDDTDGTPYFWCGAAYVYRYTGGAWAFEQKLAPTMEGTAGEPGHSHSDDKFGAAVALDEAGETIVVGAPGYNVGLQDRVGAAYVFEFDGTDWTFDQRLDPEDRETLAEFGNSVAVSHDTIAVGAHRKDEAAGTDAGAAYVFKRADSDPYAWAQYRKLTALDGDQDDFFGRSVAIFDPDGDPDEVNEQVVVGAPFYDGSGASAIGAVYSFTVGGTSANQTENAAYELAVVDDGFTGFDWFGWSVDVFDGLIAVGAPGRDAGGTAAGAMYLIDSANPGNWETDGVFVPTTQTSDEQFGYSVAISGHGVAVTGPGYDSSQDQAALHFFAYNRTPAAQDMELVVAGATGTSYQCGSVFGIDPFEGDAVTYSIIPAVPDDGYQEHGTFSFDDPANPEVVTYTPTAGLGYPVSDTFRYKVTDGDGAEDIAEVTVYFGSAQILNRGIFYAGDFGDARDISREADDDMTVEPGVNDNIVTHPNGITGVIIDVAFPSNPEAFSPADFACLYYDGDSWETVVPTEISVEVVTNLQEEEGTGTGDDYDCHRVRLTFSPGIKNWLEVTMYDAALGVSQDRFYFGYLEGDATADGIVNSDDINAIREYWLTNPDPAYTVPVPGDITADGYVDSADMDLIRENWLSSVSVPPAPVRGMAMASSSSFSSSRSSTRSSTPEWTAEADKVFADYGIGDDDLTNDLAIDEKFWERLYEALGLTW